LWWRGKTSFRHVVVGDGIWHLKQSAQRQLAFRI
jgi:hypothetical protein